MSNAAARVLGIQKLEVRLDHVRMPTATVDRDLRHVTQKPFWNAEATFVAQFKCNFSIQACKSVSILWDIISICITSTVPWL
jgi:hypothetical protein